MNLIIKMEISNQYSILKYINGNGKHQEVNVYEC